jgi:hypothetical protein
MEKAGSCESRLLFPGQFFARQVEFFLIIILASARISEPFLTHYFFSVLVHDHPDVAELQSLADKIIVVSESVGDVGSSEVRHSR